MNRRCFFNYIYIVVWYICCERIFTVAQCDCQANALLRTPKTGSTCSLENWCLDGDRPLCQHKTHTHQHTVFIWHHSQQTYRNVYTMKNNDASYVTSDWPTKYHHFAFNLPSFSSFSDYFSCVSGKIFSIFHMYKCHFGITHISIGTDPIQSDLDEWPDQFQFIYHRLTNVISYFLRAFL